MEYKAIKKGRFLERPNRFIARVEIADGQDGEPKVETVHVKNTGRCRELLQKGAVVYLEKSGNPSRSTAYDLVAVEKGERLVNMDSQAPNRAVEEWLRGGGFSPDVTLVKPEARYGNSRFDFYLEAGGERIFMEVKGVTLEEEGVVRFPDAPSERAVKHVEELIAAKQEGYRVFVLFVIQMKNVLYFTPNRDTHPEFADALCEAARAGVEILAYDCLVKPDSMTVNRPVPVAISDMDIRAVKEAQAIKETLRKNSGKYKLENICIPLLKWYDKNRRILPWREAPTPYRVWVSEIMLQQTRVEAVKPYFERFMKALPDVRALAEAEEETLLKLWEGLGYYNRARNLQKAAVQIQKLYGGRMPDTFEELLALSGIGSYTAGAIASIAFQRPVPAVDGNVLRVVARLRQDGRCIDDAKVKMSVEQDLKEIMPKDRPGDFNQAMMEIGACVCIPNGAPLCGDCPLADMCESHRAGAEQEYPRRQAKKARQTEKKTILIVQREDKTAVRKRANRGLLAGMYEFPSMEGFCTAEEVAGYLAENGLEALSIQPLEDAKHIFSHREWHMKGYLVRVGGPEPGKLKAPFRDWVYIEPWQTKDKFPIPSVFGAYMKYLSGKPGKNSTNEEEHS